MHGSLCTDSRPHKIRDHHRDLVIMPSRPKSLDQLGLHEENDEYLNI